MNPTSFKAADGTREAAEDNREFASVMSSIASDAYKFEAQIQLSSSKADVAELISSGVLTNLEIVNATREETGKRRNENARS